ncbi:CysB family HTH-type transcriptional regulator [Pigmentiphaga soli]|uniref:CysB family HTH-type transcriptional regulator n=1 Tax=Pigmentiphaga soli TaxID=1007095 RepID=A0ABP8HRX2_9BURK
MNLRHIRYFCTLAECGFNMSRAAGLLHTSQPSISRHIQALEDELGIALLRRGKKRVTGLTVAGAEALKAARRMLREADNLKKLGSEFSSHDSGRLVVTTSHTHAMYVLPKVLEAFARDYPKVQVNIRQGNPQQLTEWLVSGEADVSISSTAVRPPPELALLPCYEHPVVILVPNRHPLLAKRTVSIRDLADIPLITYNAEFSIHTRVMEAFKRGKTTPNIVLSATDVDVMKTYVKHGLGIAIMTSLGYDAKQDRGLKAIDAKHLFGATRIHLGVRRFDCLRQYALHFIRLFSPELSPEVVTSEIFREEGGGEDAGATMWRPAGTA